MPRGGKRQGAGRKKAGSTSSASSQVSENPQRSSSLLGSSSSEKIKEEVQVNEHLQGIHNQQQGCNQSPESHDNQAATPSIDCDTRSRLHGSNQGDQIEIKEASQISNQNEPKEIIKEESENAVNSSSNSVREGQPVREAKSDSHGEKAKPKLGASRRGKRELGADDSKLLSNFAEGLRVGGHSEDVCDNGGARSPSEHSRQGSGQLLPESSSGCSDQHTEQSNQSRPATGNIANPSPINIPLAQQLALLRNPVSFCQTFCSSHQYVQWQRDFLSDCRVVDDNGTINLGDWPRTVVLAAINGSGKTEILADVIRYLLSTVPGCVIPITSPIYRQLEMLENYLKAQNHKFQGWTCIEGKLTAPNGNFARWFATDTPTAVESFHGQFLVRIIEEAKSFPDEIFDQTNRWQPKLTIMVSSKGLTKGRLYESLTKHRHFNRVHEVDATMCPWIQQKWIDQQIEQHGRDSSLVKSMIFNEFSDVDVKNLISLEQINRCFGNPQPWRNPGFRVGGLDLSSAREGADKMVGVCRQGNKLFEPYYVPACKSVMEAIGYVTNWIKREQLKIVFVDNGGMGGVAMIDMLLQNFMGDKSVEIHRVNFGGKPINDQSFCKNRATELWSDGQHKIEMRDLIFDWTQKAKSEFITQVTSRQVETMSTGEIRLESKQKMDESPDLADATFLSLIEPAYERKSITGLGKTDWSNFKEEGQSTGGWGRTTSGRSLGRG
jgi:hypothetical protein